MTVEEIAERLVAQNKRVSVAEADTCGLIGYMLSTVPGSSRYLTGTDYGISVTGVAGPTGGRSGLPVGTFYVGLVGPNNLEVAERIHTDAGERDGNKHQAAQATLDLLGRHL
jgi:nicotinamide mononucleotide (NMN) deamidase PncC